MPQEQGVNLQTDTLQTVPGGPIRTIVATIPVNGVPTQVQMQVVSIADEKGNIFDPQAQASMVPLLTDILDVLIDVRMMLGKVAEVPIIDHPGLPVEIGGLTQP